MTVLEKCCTASCTATFSAGASSSDPYRRNSNCRLRGRERKPPPFEQEEEEEEETEEETRFSRRRRGESKAGHSIRRWTV